MRLAAQRHPRRKCGLEAVFTFSCPDRSVPKVDIT
jgi:hypothetical protein